MQQLLPNHPRQILQIPPNIGQLEIERRFFNVITAMAIQDESNRMNLIQKCSSLEQKWMFVMQNESRLITPVKIVIDKLRSFRLDTITNTFLEKLKVDLRNNPANWVKEFIQQEGISLLMSLLHSSVESTNSTVTMETVRYHIFDCIASITKVNTFETCLKKTKDFALLIYEYTHKSTSLKSKAVGLQILEHIALHNENDFRQFLFILCYCNHSFCFSTLLSSFQEDVNRNDDDYLMYWKQLLCFLANILKALNLYTIELFLKQQILLFFRKANILPFVNNLQYNQLSFEQVKLDFTTAFQTISDQVGNQPSIIQLLNHLTNVEQQNVIHLLEQIVNGPSKQPVLALLGNLAQLQTVEHDLRIDENL